MASSLDKLSSYLKNDQKVIAKQFCRNIDELKLLQKKDIIPDDYVDDWKKLQDTVLTAKRDFFNILRNCGVSDDD